MERGVTIHVKWALRKKVTDDGMCDMDNGVYWERFISSNLETIAPVKAPFGREVDSFRWRSMIRNYYKTKSPDEVKWKILELVTLHSHLFIDLLIQSTCTEHLLFVLSIRNTNGARRTAYFWVVHSYQQRTTESRMMGRDWSSLSWEFEYSCFVCA